VPAYELSLRAVVSVDTLRSRCNLHSIDEPARKRIDVRDMLIGEGCSCTVADDLMNRYNDASRAILRKRHWFDGRIERLLLPRPVTSHGIVPVYKATSVLPFDVGVHDCQRRSMSRRLNAA
jgi:hypothetical protein